MEELEEELRVCGVQELWDELRVCGVGWGVVTWRCWGGGVRGGDEGLCGGVVTWKCWGAGVLG